MHLDYEIKFIISDIACSPMQLFQFDTIFINFREYLNIFGANPL